jgi:hypothetical protein
MTYGENAGVIRDELAALLCHHRIQQRWAGPASTPCPAPRPRRAPGHGKIIRRYRDAALTFAASRRWGRSVTHALR